MLGQVHCAESGTDGCRDGNPSTSSFATDKADSDTDTVNLDGPSLTFRVPLDRPRLVGAMIGAAACVSIHEVLAESELPSSDKRNKLCLVRRLFPRASPENLGREGTIGGLGTRRWPQGGPATGWRCRRQTPEGRPRRKRGRRGGERWQAFGEATVAD